MPVTQRDIAARAGVSRATVSYALRDDPQVSTPERMRIQNLARDLGWRPNPLLSDLLRSARHRRRAAPRCSLAYLSDLPGSLHPLVFAAHDSWLRSARDHALSLGHSLDALSLGGHPSAELPRDHARLLRQLDARGIDGLVLSTGHRASAALLDWGPRAVVVLGRYPFHAAARDPVAPARCPYHTVESHFYQNTHLALACLRRLGARRVGLVLSAYRHAASDGLYAAAVHQDFATRACPPLLLPEATDFSCPPPLFRAWFRRHRPDALLCVNNEIPVWLRTLGLRVPEDVAVAHLALGPGEPDWSGIDELAERQIQVALDLLFQQLLHGQRFAPRHPHQVFVPGVWRAGSTA